MYNSMFEFGARVAVYRILKTQFQSQMAKQLGIPSNSPRIALAANQKAVAYTKNLANFEERGTLTRGLGAAYMFFGASAVGSRQGLKALAPSWRKYEAVANTLPEVIQKDPVKMATFKKEFMRKKLLSRIVMGAMIGMGYSLWHLDRKSTRLNSSHSQQSRMPSSA